LNKAKVSLEQAVEMAKTGMVEVEYKARLERESLGNLFQIPGTPEFFPPAGSRHPLSLVLQLTANIFEEIGYEVVSGPENSPEIENDFFNFQALGMPPEHPARDMQDTFYINTTFMGRENTGSASGDTLLLRTHTSAVQIREMEKRKPPFKIVCPGRVYRKDDVDATHYPVFHQCEILAVDEIGKLTLPHLLGTVKYFLQKMFGKDIEVKYRSSYFPFTEPSIEVDVFFKGRWLEVLGCGMVDPVVLEAVGLDSKKYAGFAAGFGIERFAMIMHNITDIRNFWENRLDWLEQFPSRPYAIPGDDDEERARDELSKGFDDFSEWDDHDK
jgi:phenylalanyl-tRNA synthetase alpha chain